jgi:hypothetical protein
MPFDKMLVAIAVATSGNFFAAEALAQRPEAPPPIGQRPPPSGVETPGVETPALPGEGSRGR